jgi:hypothetical protein
MKTFTVSDIAAAASSENGGPSFVQLVETIAEFHSAVMLQRTDPHRWHGLEKEQDKVFAVLTDFMNTVKPTRA